MRKKTSTTKMKTKMMKMKMMKMMMRTTKKMKIAIIINKGGGG